MTFDSFVIPALMLLLGGMWIWHEWKSDQRRAENDRLDRIMREIDAQERGRQFAMSVRRHRREQFERRIAAFRSQKRRPL